MEAMKEIMKFMEHIVIMIRTDKINNNSERSLMTMKKLLLRFRFMRNRASSFPDSLPINLNEPFTDADLVLARNTQSIISIIQAQTHSDIFFHTKNKQINTYTCGPSMHSNIEETQSDTEKQKFSSASS